jgi:hypothetical protein
MACIARRQDGEPHNQRPGNGLAALPMIPALAVRSLPGKALLSRAQYGYNFPLRRIRRLGGECT